MSDNKTRDLFIDGFTAADFDTLNLDFSFDTPANMAAELATALLRAALAEAQVVYSADEEPGLWDTDKCVADSDTRCARLVAVTKLEAT